MPKLLKLSKEPKRKPKKLSVSKVPSHIPATVTHMHYRNTCPMCQKSSECKCAVPDKVPTSYVCAKCTQVSEMGRQSISALVGKTVTFESDGVRVAGLVSKHVGSDMLAVRLALPDANGMLVVTDSEIVHPTAGLEVISAVTSERNIKAWSDIVPFEVGKKFITIRDKEEGEIEDYQNVIVSGFASTFQKVTPADRDGDYVMDTAFDKTLMAFRRNPVMLVNHDNSVESLVGSYTKVGITDTGLAVEGALTNSPKAKHVRFLVVEGHLKAFSIGGFFLYADDGRGIEEVRLYEISLVAIPANPDALFSCRSLDLSDVTKCWKDKQKYLRTWMR